MTTLLIHEFLRTRGMLATMLVAATAFVIVACLLVLSGVQLFVVLGFLLGGGAVILLLPAVQLGLAIDYWRSAYGRAGYLTHTLPLPGSTIYRARLVYGLGVATVALSWSVLLTVPLALLSARSATPPGVSTWSHLLAQISAATPLMTGPLWALAAVTLVLVSWSYLVQYYFAASIGSERALSRLGPFGPVLVWFILYLVSQVVVLVTIVGIPFAVGSTGGSLGIVPFSVLDGANAADGLPLGVPIGIALITVGLIWRTARSWTHKVSLT